MIIMPSVNCINIYSFMYPEFLPSTAFRRSRRGSFMKKLAPSSSPRTPASHSTIHFLSWTLERAAMMRANWAMTDAIAAGFSIYVRGDKEIYIRISQLFTWVVCVYSNRNEDEFVKAYCSDTYVYIHLEFDGIAFAEDPYSAYCV